MKRALAIARQNVPDVVYLLHPCRRPALQVFPPHPSRAPAGHKGTEVHGGQM